MDEYKKRVRIFAERSGFILSYIGSTGLRVSDEDAAIEFIPVSRTEMMCSLSTSSEKLEFQIGKKFVFDLLDRFANGRSLISYVPRGAPLSLQDYVDEEHAANEINDLLRKISAGTATNIVLGGNHYLAEYYNGILILKDDFTGAPTNIIDLSRDA